MARTRLGRLESTLAATYVAKVGRDALNERHREWRREKAAADPEWAAKQRARNRAWYGANRERMAELTRRWAVENPDRSRIDSRNAAAQRRARMRGATGTVAQAEWEAKLAEYDGLCAYCGEPATTRDHVLPLSRGGTHELENLVPACARCNFSKGDKLLSEWRGSPHESAT